MVIVGIRIIAPACLRSADTHFFQQKAAGILNLRLFLFERGKKKPDEVFCPRRREQT